MIKIGMVVRYATNWCSTPEERKYLHIVRENRLNPITGMPTRWLIETINSALTLRPIEEVDECMIEDAGLTIDDLIAVNQ